MERNYTVIPPATLTVNIGLKTKRTLHLVPEKEMVLRRELVWLVQPEIGETAVQYYAINKQRNSKTTLTITNRCHVVLCTEHFSKRYTPEGEWVLHGSYHIRCSEHLDGTIKICGHRDKGLRQPCFLNATQQELMGIVWRQLAEANLVLTSEKLQVIRYPETSNEYFDRW